MSKFWHLDQNNSGGDFVYDEKRGLTHHVVVEANSVDQASARAQDAGVYFDGVREGMDCGCCGDRWYEPYGEGDDEPKVYEQPVSKYESTFEGWMDEGREICVHYLDGRLEWHGIKKIPWEEAKMEAARTK